MVLLSKAAIQKSGDSVYVRVYIPSEVVQKLGISEQNPYIMWNSLHGSIVLAQSFPLLAAKELLLKQQQQQQISQKQQTKIFTKRPESLELDIL